MKTLRNLFLILLFGGALTGVAAVVFFDPPTPTRMIETPATLQDRK